MSNECIHTHSNLAKSGIWSIDCEIWDMGYWGVKNLGYGILGVKNLGYGILGGKKSGIWDMGTPVSPPPIRQTFLVDYTNWWAYSVNIVYSHHDLLTLSPLI